MDAKGDFGLVKDELKKTLLFFQIFMGHRFAYCNL